MSEVLLPTRSIELRRLLPRWGVLSRGQCDRAVAERRIVHNGRLVEDSHVLVDPTIDVVLLDGVRVAALPRVYLKVNKPKGVVTTLNDPEGRRTVLDLIPKDRPEWRRAKPVGRLDRDSSGLLLLTTDGDFHFAITGPESTIEKVYRVEVVGHHDLGRFEPLVSGFVLGGERLAPMRTTLVEHRERTTLLELTLTQGRFRQIRRVMLALGLRVVSLHRIRIGGIELGSLASGALVPLSVAEIPEGSERER